MKGPHACRECLFSAGPVISLLAGKAIIISVMSKDILMAAIPPFRIIKAWSRGLAKGRIKTSLDNKGVRQGLMDQDPLSTSTLTHIQLLILIRLNPAQEVAFRPRFSRSCTVRSSS